MQLPGYANALKDGAATALTAALPSALTQPDPAEWKSELTALEWNLVGPTWVAIGREILDKDPWFGFVKYSKYIDGWGRFTTEFKSKPWYPRYVAELAWRMDEELEFYRAHFDRVIQAAKASPLERTDQDEGDGEGADEPLGGDSAFDAEAADLWLPKINWSRAFEIGVKVWNSERRIVLWTPQGIAANIAWEVGVRSAIWGYKEYRQHQRAQQREHRQQTHTHKRIDASSSLEELDGLLLKDAEVAEYMATVGETMLHGFFPPGLEYAGTWATQIEPRDKSYEWRLPGVAYSQDGVYL